MCYQFAFSFESGDMGYWGKLFKVRESGLLAERAGGKSHQVIPNAWRLPFKYTESIAYIHRVD